MFDLLNVTTTL